MTLHLKCSKVIDGHKQFLNVSDYCPKIGICDVGTHVMCMHYDPVSNPVNILFIHLLIKIYTIDNISKHQFLRSAHRKLPITDTSLQVRTIFQIKLNNINKNFNHKLEIKR